MIFSNNEWVLTLLLLLQTSVADFVAPLAEATCRCSTPLQGTVGANRYDCNNGVIGFCGNDEECYRTDTFLFTERGGPASCRQESSTVSCSCSTPGAGTVGFNGIECSDGTTSTCDSRDECYLATPVDKVHTNVEDLLCRKRPTPRATCNNLDVRLETYPAGRISIYHNGIWNPLCGLGFWENNHGAETVCKKLGYASGTVVMEKQVFQENALEIGECQNGQDLAGCSGAKDFTSQCSRGNPVGVRAVCSNPGSIYAEDAECDDDPSDDDRTKVEVVIGTSFASNVKTVNSPAKGGVALTCPVNVNRDVWLGGEDWEDSFKITVNGDTITAQRLDSSNGWAMNLRIECTMAASPVTPDKLMYEHGEEIKVTWEFDSSLDGEERIAIYPSTSVEGVEAPLDASTWMYTCGSRDCGNSSSVTCAPGQRCTRELAFNANADVDWPLSAGVYRVVLLHYSSAVIVSRSNEFTVIEHFKPLTKTVFGNGEVALPQKETDSCEDAGYLAIDNEIDCELYCRHNYGRFEEGEYAAGHTGCFVVVGSAHKDNCHWNKHQNPNNSGTKALCWREAALEETPEAEVGYVDITIGPSTSPTNPVKSVTTSETGFECPKLVNRNNWATGHQFHDAFEVTVDGGNITVNRTDSVHGWGLNLILRCPTVKHEQSSCIKHGRVSGECCGLPNEISCGPGYKLQQPLRTDRCDDVACPGKCGDPSVRAYRCVPIDEVKGWQRPILRNMGCYSERQYQGRIGLSECQKRCELDPLCKAIFGSLEYGDRTCYTCQDYSPRPARQLKEVNHSPKTAPKYYKTYELKRETRWAFSGVSEATNCPGGFEAVSRQECEKLGRAIISTESRTNTIVDDDDMPNGCTIRKDASNLADAVPRWSTGSASVVGTNRRLVCKHKIPSDGLVSYDYTNYKTPVVSGGLDDTVLNGARCVDKHIDSYCLSQPSKNAYLEFGLKKPLMVMRVWVANRGDSNVNGLGRFNVKVHNSHSWQTCAERKHISTINQWTEVYCEEPILGYRVRIELADHMDHLNIADVRVQGIKPADAVIQNPIYTPIVGHHTCDEKAIIKDISCPIGSTSTTCVDLGRQECEALGLNCWGYAVTAEEFSSVTAIQLYDRGALKPFTCDGEMGLKQHRQWTTYKRKHTQITDHIVFHRPCYIYNWATDHVDYLFGCTPSQRALAEQAVARMRRSRPCALLTSMVERQACVEENIFRQQVGEKRYKIYAEQKATTLNVCSFEKRRNQSRRLEEELMAELKREIEHDILVSRLNRDSGARRRLQAQSQCRRRAAENNEAACSNLKAAADKTVELYQDQVALQQEQVEQLRTERDLAISSGAFGLLADVWSIAANGFTGNVFGLFSGTAGLISNAVSYGFAIDDANKEIEFAEEEARLLSVEADIEAQRDLSDLVQTCDQASTDDLGCELEELSDRVNDRFLTIIETSTENHIEIMKSLGRQNQIIQRTSLVLDEVLDKALETLNLANSIQDIKINYETALEDLQFARDEYRAISNPVDGHDKLRARSETEFIWCHEFINKFSDKLLLNIQRWVISDHFFDLEKPEGGNNLEGYVTQCDLQAWKEAYTRRHRAVVAIFDFAVTIRKYSLGWTGVGNLHTLLRAKMAKKYSQRIDQIESTSTAAIRCVGDPFTCPANHQATHGPNKSSNARRTGKEPVGERPCEPIQCMCENGEGVAAGQCSDPNALKCKSCHPGYKLQSSLCVPQQSTCTNGKPPLIHTEDGHDGKEYCTECNPGYYLKTVEEHLRTYKTCAAARCACNHPPSWPWTGDQDGARCPASIRVKDLSDTNQRTDRKTSQCRTCNGPGMKIVRYQASEHEVGHSDHCVRTDYGYLAFYTTDFTDTAETNDLRHWDVKRKWIGVRSLIVFPGYCVEFRLQHGNRGDWAFYCNCHERELNDHRAVGFSNFNDYGAKGWKRAKRLTCNETPDWVEAWKYSGRQRVATVQRAHYVNYYLSWKFAGAGFGQNGRPRTMTTNI